MALPEGLGRENRVLHPMSPPSIGSAGRGAAAQGMGSVGCGLREAFEAMALTCGMTGKVDGAAAGIRPALGRDGGSADTVVGRSPAALTVSSSCTVRMTLGAFP